MKKIHRLRPIEFGRPLTMGAETTTRHRGFYIIDRSRAMSFHPLDITPELTAALFHIVTLANPVTLDGQVFTEACIGRTPVVKFGNGGECPPSALPVDLADPALTDPGYDFIAAPLWTSQLVLGPSSSVTVRDAPNELEIHWADLRDATDPTGPTVSITLHYDETLLPSIHYYYFDDGADLTLDLDFVSQLRLAGPSSTFTLCKNPDPDLDECPEQLGPGPLLPAGVSPAWVPFQSMPVERAEWAVVPEGTPPSTADGADSTLAYTHDFDPACADPPACTTPFADGSYVLAARSCDSNGCSAWQQTGPIQVMNNRAPVVDDIQGFQEPGGQSVGTLTFVSGTVRMEAEATDPDATFAGVTGVSLDPSLFDPSPGPAPPWPQPETFSPLPGFAAGGCWEATDGSRSGFTCGPDLTQIIVQDVVVPIDPSTMTEGVRQTFGAAPHVIAGTYRFLEGGGSSNLFVLKIEAEGPLSFEPENTIEIRRQLALGGAAEIEEREFTFNDGNPQPVFVRSLVATDPGGVQPNVVQYLISSKERDHRSVEQRDNGSGITSLRAPLVELPAVYIAVVSDHPPATIDGYVESLLQPTGLIPGTRVESVRFEVSSDGGGTFHDPPGGGAKAGLDARRLHASFTDFWDTTLEPAQVFQAQMRAIADDGDLMGAPTLSILFDVDNSMPIPVLLSDFVARRAPEGVELEWYLGAADELVSLGIERRIGQESPQRVNAAPLPVRTGRNAYVDIEPLAAGARTVTYALTLQFADGTAMRGPEAVLGAPTLPAHVVLQPNAPNPFNPRTTLRFQLPRPSEVQLRIFDVAGHTVQTLVHEGLPAGSHTVVWDGTDGRGARVSTGIYFAELRAAGESRRIRMNLLK